MKEAFKGLHIAITVATCLPRIKERKGGRKALCLGYCPVWTGTRGLHETVFNIEQTVY